MLEYAKEKGIGASTPRLRRMLRACQSPLSLYTLPLSWGCVYTVICCNIHFGVVYTTLQSFHCRYTSLQFCYTQKRTGAKGIAPRNKKLLGAPGLTTRNKDATRSKKLLGMVNDKTLHLSSREAGQPHSLDLRPLTHEKHPALFKTLRFLNQK